MILLPFWVLAATINVPGDQPTIQAGIDAAIDDDMVLLADGIYTGVGNYNIDFSGKSIAVVSIGGPDNCIVDCQGLGRGFLAYSGETVYLEGLRIKNGNALCDGCCGGGVYVNYNNITQTNVTIFDCVFEGNRASDGGGIYAKYSEITINHCTFINNSVSSQGSAIYARNRYNASITSRYTDCIFTGNSAAQGGAVYSSSYSAFVNCTFADNSASQEGGAVYSYFDFWYSSRFTDCKFTNNSASSGGAVSAAAAGHYDRTSLSFTNCIFTNNRAAQGGAICSDYALFTSTDLNACTFKGNRASQEGGAIYSRSSSVYPINSIFTSNFAAQGGAVCSLDSYIYLTNCTVIANEASIQGGAIWCDNFLDDDPIILKNCIFWGDTAAEGPEIYENNHPVVITYSDIQGGHTGEGNIDNDPALLSSDNVYFKPWSPCINTANTDDAPDYDLDGYLRPIGDEADMGAYEYRNDVFVWDGVATDSGWGDTDCWNMKSTPKISDIVVLSLPQSTFPESKIQSEDAVAGNLYIESGCLTIDQGKLTIGGS